MKNLYVVTIAFILLFTNTILGQDNDVSYKSWFKEKYKEANLLYLEKNYDNALKNFLELYRKDTTNANINYKVGLCYLNSANEKNKALRYLEKAAKKTSKRYDEYNPNERRVPKTIYYYLGIAYKVNYDFKKANDNLQKFKLLLGDKNTEMMTDVKKQISECVVSAELLSNPINVRIKNLGPNINTKYPEYTPIINADESILIYTTRTPNTSGGNIDEDGLGFEDLYMSTSKSDSTWNDPTPIENLNTNANDAAISLTADGQQLLLYKDLNGGDIYQSKLEGSSWSMPEPMGSDINSPAWEPSACISADGNTLYFVSNRKGGLGGRDIYRCVKLPNGQWSLGTNLGSPINTPYDEDAPFLHPDGITLFFASNGGKGMGGFDVFYSVLKNRDLANWVWSSPINVGSPINTPDDDVFYVLSTDGKRAYYSSSKPGGYGEKDLYVVNVPSVVSEPTVLLKGFLTYDGKEKSAGNVKILVTDNETGVVVQEIRPNSKTGKYLLILNPGANGKSYTLTYDATGYQPYIETIKIEPGSAYQLIERILDLKSINFESKTQGTLAITGKITNKENGVIIPTKITVKNNKTEKLIDTFYNNPTSGVYYFVLPRGEDYNISYESEGFLFFSDNVSLPKDGGYDQFVKDVSLEKVKAGSTIVLKNIFFDSNKSTLKSESNIELETLYKLLADNPNIMIEISGHTDSQGKEDANKKLSKDRAQAVVDYLVNQKSKVYRVAPYFYKGIDGKRLIARGYGSTKPIAPNKLANGKPDLQGMQLNRRVEIKILDSKELELLKSSTDEQTNAPSKANNKSVKKKK